MSKLGQGIHFPRLPKLRRRKRFAPVEGNSLQLLDGGEPYYEHLAAAIAVARHEVLLNTYLWADDETGRLFLEAAAGAARRGVSVAVLVDGVGSFSLQERQLQALRDAGARAAVWGPVHRWLRRWWRMHRLLRRNHRKNCIIDGRLAWTGGAGIADYWTARCHPPWRDLMAAVEGPIAGQFRDVFHRDWRRATGESLPDLPMPAPAGESTRTAGEQLRVLATSLTRRELTAELHHAVRHAGRRAWFASPYFVPSFLLRRRLTAAARRGVDVRLLLPGPGTDHRIVWFAGRRHYGKLLAEGVRIFEHTCGLQHAKYALVDDSWGFVGSSNLDAWSARYNLELDLELHSRGALAQVEGRFQADLGNSHEIKREAWRARPLHMRLAERLFGWVDPLL